MSKAPRVTTKTLRPAEIKSGEVPVQKIGQIRGKGQNAGGLPNSLKQLFPKSSRAIPKYGNGGKVISTKTGC
jgi:hypothetical protein